MNNTFRMCYAIASLQLLYSLPAFSRCFVQTPTPEDDPTKNALQHLAKCSLHPKKSGNDVSNHSEVIFKNIAQKYCGMAVDLEHDPAEFTAKFIEYLTKAASTSIKISREMFETEIKAHSVSCQE
jgi:hypothetical protein